jgi:hypothetical protein
MMSGQIDFSTGTPAALHPEVRNRTNARPISNSVQSNFRTLRDHIALFALEPATQRRQDQLQWDHDENLPDLHAG